MDERKKITNFKDLDAWQEGHKLVLLVYECAKSFPSIEKYALADQMKRAAISITSNIAEGFSRQSYKEKIQFYSMAQGSVTELQSQLAVAVDVGYLNRGRFDEINDQSVKVHKIVNGLIRGSKAIAYG